MPKEFKTYVERHEMTVSWDGSSDTSPYFSSHELALTSYVFSSPFITLNLTGCCIYHSRKTFGESDSDESDSDIDEAERKEAAEGPAATKRNYQRHHA